MALVATSESVGARLSLNGLQHCFVRAEDHSRFALVDPNGELMCSGYDHLEERVAIGPRLIRLHVLLYPTPERWDALLGLIGFTEGGSDVWTPMDTLTEFNAQLDYDGVDVGNYLSGKVDVAIIRGQQGLNPVSCELQMIFQNADLTAAFSGTAETKNAAYEFTSGTLGLGSTGADSRLFNSFVIVYNNHLRVRFNNQTTATNIANTQRTIHFACNTPFTSSELDLLSDAIVDSTRLSGQEATLAFTRSPQSMSWFFENLKWETSFPSIPRKDAEIRLGQQYKAFAQGSDPVVTVTNVLA